MPLAQLVPPPIAAHYHHAVLIWALFLVGTALHAALQINSIAAKNKLGFVTVLKVVAIPVMFRAFACAMVFLLIWQNPDLVGKLLGLFGHPLSPDETAVFSIPMNNAIAGLYGMFLDSMLGYIPWLKSQLPTVDVPAQAALGEAKAAVIVAEQKIDVAKQATQQPKP